jgi:NADH dehydrogenase [ubiquinone] 1 alpha subcomplex assembly factor 7
MRSIISTQARDFARSVGRGRYRRFGAAVRWSGSDARQWSTPLAKQLSEAITVQFLVFQMLNFMN